MSLHDAALHLKRLDNYICDLLMQSVHAVGSFWIWLKPSGYALKWDGIEDFYWVSWHVLQELGARESVEMV